MTRKCLTTWRAVVALITLASLTGCNGRAPDSTDASDAPDSFDIAIVTVIAAEYEAMLAHMDRTFAVDMPEGRSNTFAWTGAEIDRRGGGAPIRAIVALAGEAGTTSGALAVIETARTWRPELLVVAGIAGGFEPQVRRGDVVIAETVWGYEYGAISANFAPRYDWIFHPDAMLVAEAAAYRGTWQDTIRVERPDGEGAPTQVTGITGSGNKVIETLDSAFAERVMGAMPGIVSIEMEAAGAFAAAEVLSEDADAPRVLMLRGISDVPNPKSGLFGDKADRERWKRYASDSVAAFTVGFLRDRQAAPAIEAKHPTDVLVVTFNDLVYEALDSGLGEMAPGVAIRRLRDKGDLADLERSLSELNPKAVLLVDTALGIAPTRIGDVIASRLIWPYEVDEAFDARMDAALRSSRSLIASVQAVEARVFRHDDRGPVLKAGTIAASETLPDWSDGATIRAVSDRNPRTAIIDDESWVVANHLYRRGAQPPKFVSIQAAERVAGASAVDSQLASENAARAGIELLRQHSLSLGD